MQPYFPDWVNLIEILQAELPEGVYAPDFADDDDLEKRSYSSSELRAHAELLALAYENLGAINQDKFIETSTSQGLTLWEKELFSQAQDSSLDLETRRQNVLAKFRSSGGISLPSIKSVLEGLLNVPFKILPYSGQTDGESTGAFVLNESNLDQSTYLALRDPIYGASREPGVQPLNNDLNFALAGITGEELADEQQTAYTYEVQIFGEVSAMQLTLVDKTLTALEPARSTHKITFQPTPNPDADILDLGPAQGQVIDWIEFGDGGLNGFDVWNFGGI